MSTLASLVLYGLKRKGLGTCRHSSLSVHTKASGAWGLSGGVWDQLSGPLSGPLSPQVPPVHVVAAFQDLPVDFQLGSSIGLLLGR